MSISLAIVSAADAQFFPLLKGLICSIRDKEQGVSPALCIFDLGLTVDQQRWLAVQGARFRRPDWRFRREVSAVIKGLLARPYIPDYFPGYDTYLWMDADTWVQDWEGVDAYLEGAARTGFCIAAAVDPAYPMMTVVKTQREIFDAYDSSSTERLLSGPIVNAGVFAGACSASHWKAWAREVEERIDVSHLPGVDFFFDQAALNAVINKGDLSTAILPAQYNWMCHWALPALSEDGQNLLHPLAPHRAIHIIHLTQATKRGAHRLKTPRGGTLTRWLRYQAPSVIPPGDYVSPGLAVILPDVCFPHMIVGDKASNAWPYLRRKIPHNYYTDARASSIGFANRDEAAILYNTALRFRGKSGLEIGCFMGWSAVHLALGGVVLDVIDPNLANSDVRASVQNSLEQAMVPGPIRLIAAFSPDAVEELGRAEGKRWPIFFIDGNHDEPGPLQDAIVCERFAADDAIVLFHDLVAPAVARGLFYFREKGWRIRIYHTAQIMGVAWRGNVEPVHHRPDPRISWPIPEHLLDLVASD